MVELRCPAILEVLFDWELALDLLQVFALLSVVVGVAVGVAAAVAIVVVFRIMLFNIV